MITPSVPSEPSTSSRSAGPPRSPGASSVASEPDGVTHSSATTCSSIRPCPVDVCPAERVAAQPPTVAHSYALRHVPQRQPLRAQRRVGLGQPDARLEHRDPRPRIDRDHAVQPAEIRATPTANVPLAREPADDARPAPERHHGDALLAAQAQHRRDLRRVPGATTASGADAQSPARCGQQVQVRLPAAAQHPRLTVVAHLGDRREPLAQPVRQHRRPATTRPPAPPARDTTPPEIPSSPRSSSPACSGSDGPAPGSPQPQKTCSRLTRRRRPSARRRRCPSSFARPPRNDSSTRKPQPAITAPRPSISSASAARRPAGGQQIVVQQHPRAVGQRVGVHLQRVDAVLEDVLGRHGLPRQLARACAPARTRRRARAPAPRRG